MHQGLPTSPAALMRRICVISTSVGPACSLRVTSLVRTGATPVVSLHTLRVGQGRGKPCLALNTQHWLHANLVGPLRCWQSSLRRKLTLTHRVSAAGGARLTSATRQGGPTGRTHTRFACKFMAAHPVPTVTVNLWCIAGASLVFASMLVLIPWDI